MITMYINILFVVIVNIVITTIPLLLMITFLCCREQNFGTWMPLQDCLRASSNDCPPARTHSVPYAPNWGPGFVFASHPPARPLKQTWWGYFEAGQGGQLPTEALETPSRRRRRQKDMTAPDLSSWLPDQKSAVCGVKRSLLAMFAEEGLRLLGKTPPPRNLSITARITGDPCPLTCSNAPLPPWDEELLPHYSVDTVYRRRS